MDREALEELKKRLELDTKSGHGRLNLLGQYIDERRRPTVGHSQLWNVIGAVREDIAKLIAEVERSQWQPIETAPKDGREVLVRVKRGVTGGESFVGHYMPGGHCIEDHPPIDEGWYFWNGGMFDKAAKPTHWMPLPTPPALQSGGSNAKA